MKCTVVDGDLDPGNGEFHLRALGHAFLKAFFTGGDEMGGNRSTLDLVVENEICIPFDDRFHIPCNSGILPRTSCLLLVDVVEIRTLGDGLPVGNPRLPRFDNSPIFTFHPFDIDLQVEFAHPFDDGLVGFIVHMGAESRVFLCKTVERFGHVDLGQIVLRKDRK